MFDGEFFEVFVLVLSGTRGEVVEDNIASFFTANFGGVSQHDSAFIGLVAARTRQFRFTRLTHSGRVSDFVSTIVLE